ncbi:MAG: iron-containing alcohol dehydrogenase [Phycisphaerae bacterium]
MMDAALPLPDVLSDSLVRVLFGFGAIEELGREALRIGATRVLVVTDPGIERAGHLDTALQALGDASLPFALFDGAGENPTTEHVAAGMRFARRGIADLIIGLGGGSAMDCAKGINVILTNGRTVADYWGIDRTTRPLLPMILVPTTAGTGSEAQSFALITDPKTHQKMACGDHRPPAEGGLRPHLAILDPQVVKTVPREVAAAAGIDAIAHAIETAGSTARTNHSLALSKAAWSLLDAAFPRILSGESGEQDHADMLLGAHLAGAAIEESMLGAAHACANPLTARFGLAHGLAVGLMLPSVIRYNHQHGNQPYAALDADSERLAARVTHLLELAGLPTSLAEADGCAEATDLIDELARAANAQWTAQFNPVPITQDGFAEIYRRAIG